MNAYKTRARGFTLIEILVVIGMLAILSTVVLVAVNPLRQFAEARNSQRQSNVAALLNGISERIADNGGLFISSSSESTDGCRVFLPNTAQDIVKSQLDLRPCLVSNYLSELPYDPSSGSNTCTSLGCNNSAAENYDLKYTVTQDPTTSRVTVCAPLAAEPAIAGSGPFCLTR
jgi:prepilin-type N-terminal cleavage/methylation domain-containing protein